MKEKKVVEFHKHMINKQKFNKKMLKPKIYYDDENDNFYFWFGGNLKVESTIEVSNRMRFDISEKGNILSVEIDDFSQYLKGKLKI